MTEKEWSSKVLAYARGLAWRLTYHHIPGTFSNGRWLSNTNREGVGFPDWVCLRPSYLVVLELKTEAKKPTPEQVEWLGGFAGLPNCIAMYARPRDWEVVSDVLATPWKYTEVPSTNEEEHSGTGF